MFLNTRVVISLKKEQFIVNAFWRPDLMSITFAFLLKIARASHSFIIKKIHHLLFSVSVSGKKVHKNCCSYVFRNWHNRLAFII